MVTPRGVIRRKRGGSGAYIAAAARKSPETTLQISVVSMLRRLEATGHLRALWWHSANGGNRSAAEGALFRAMGTVAGVPDLTFVDQSGSCCFVELKAPPDEILGRKKGYLSDAQKEWRRRCEKLEIPYGVCYTADEVLRYLEERGFLYPSEEDGP